jgi:predicted RNA-binding protein with TRAM domain
MPRKAIIVMGKYDDTRHDDEPILCPREKCRRRNAPVESSEFDPDCWKCGTFLNVTPVSHGDVVIVEVTDIHESGAGVGRTDDGYVVMIDGTLPPAKLRVRITNVKPNYSKGEVIEELEMEDEDDDSTEEDEEDDTPSLGSREDFFGGS